MEKQEIRIIDAKKITDVVRRLCISSNYILPNDMRNCIESSRKDEVFPIAQSVLDRIIENYNMAGDKEVPICQDTGTACVFVEIGQNVHVNGSISDAVNEGVRLGYTEGYLRKSIVSDPIKRVNSGDNTPAMIYYDITEGDSIKITVAPKGAGSENMSRIAMLKPSDGIDGVKQFILETVEKAGPNPCPPIVVGVGIGGNFDKAAFLAKKALVRDDVHNHDSYYAALEDEMLEKINSLGIGPQGFGGKTTALKVNIETFATHIASLPVAVNISCHVNRHMTEVI